MKAVLIGRATCYSPNSVEKDAAILSAVSRQLALMGAECGDIIGEDSLTQLPPADVYLTMGRHLGTLALLDNHGVAPLAMNSSCAIRLCSHRGHLMSALEKAGLPVPPLEGNDGYWVKRADGYAQTATDVQYASCRDEACEIADQMTLRGVREVEIRAHVKGDLIKFYAVRNTGFFRYYYPGDDGDWKFTSEQRNGVPCHYRFDSDLLAQMAEKAAQLVGLDIYGGDCVICPNGSPVLIDLNDWPSFSRCREEAAEAIARRAFQIIGNV